MAKPQSDLRVLENEFGFKTDERINVTLGHSLGEYAALVAGGYLDYEFVLKIVREARRGDGPVHQESKGRIASWHDGTGARGATASTP